MKTRTFVCEGCASEVTYSGYGIRATKRLCDDCLASRRAAGKAQRGSSHTPGVCPDCGDASSMKGRRCVPCGRKLAGSRKTANAAVKRASERRLAIAALRDWGAHHGGVGPTQAAWNEQYGDALRAQRIGHLVFSSWLDALDAAHLEHPSHSGSPMGRFARARFGRNRQMVTGGDLGAKAPRGDAPRLDPTVRI